MLEFCEVSELIFEVKVKNIFVFSTLYFNNKGLEKIRICCKTASEIDLTNKYGFLWIVQDYNPVFRGL